MSTRAEIQRRHAARRRAAGRPLTTDATGTRRRLQALMWLGHSQEAMSAELGVTPQAVRGWMSNRRVRLATAERVAALYDAWWLRPGRSPFSAEHARACGWVSPLAWDDYTIDDPAARPATGGKPVAGFDEIAVEQAMRGRPVRLRPVERAEAVRRLTALGFSAAEIAGRLGIAKRSATRIRTSYDEGNVA